MSDTGVCPQCGKLVTENTSAGMSSNTKSRTKAWYLLPIFFSIIGGIIAYFILKDDDKKFAKNCLWLGIILTVAGIIISAIFSAMAAMTYY